MKSLDIEGLKFQFLALKSNAKAVAVFVAMVFLLDAALLLRGQFVAVGRLSSEAARLKTSLRNAKEDSRLSPNYKTTLTNLRNDLAQYNKKIVFETELPGILESISKFADISAVRIQNIRPIAEKGSTDFEDFRKQKISVSAKCGFHQLGRFIALLESAPVFFDVKSLEIRSDAADYSKQQVTIILEVTLQKAYNTHV